MPAVSNNAESPSSQLLFLDSPGADGRKIIRNGSLTLEVRSLDRALSAIRAATAAAAGYISSESHKELEYGVRSAEITCRLPAARLDETVSAWRTLGVEEAFAIETLDITEEYFNVEVSLRNQQRLETRLLDLLNRRANRLSDLLETEKELARVRSAIDELQGRKRLQDSHVFFSTLHVTLHEPRPVIVSAEGGPWRTLLAAFSLAAENFVLSVASIIAAAGEAIPVAGCLFAGLWVVRTWWRRRRRAAQQVPARLGST